MPEFVDFVDFTNLPVTNFVLQQSAPAAPVSGSKYFNPADGHEYVYTGSAWVSTGKINNAGPISVTQNNDGTQTVSVATATTTSAGLIAAADQALISGATAAGTPGALALWNAAGGLTANVTGNVTGTASNATSLNGQSASYYLNPANLTGGVAPVSAGGTGLSTVPSNGQILVGNGTGWAVTALSAGPGLYTVVGAGTLSIGISGGVSAPVGSAYVTIGNDATLTNERSLAGAAGQITLTDGGAGGSATIGLSAVSVAGVQQPKVTIDAFGRVLSSAALVAADIPSLTKSKISDFVETAYVHTTGDEVVAGNKSFSNNVTINGNLVVGGTTTTVTSQQLVVKDNLITINDGEVGAGVTNISAGIEVDRGSLPNYYFIWDETDGNFRIGQDGSTQAVATRQDSPTAAGVAVWNATANRFDTSSALTSANILTTGSSINGSQLVAGSVPNSALTNSSLTVTAGTGLSGGGSVALGGTVTVSMPNTGTAGTYTKVTTDAQGRVTAGTTLTSADLPAHAHAYVSSVGLAAPAQFTVTNSPVTSTGTLTLAWANAAANSVFAGPNGSAGTPAFRALVAADIPSLDTSKLTSGTLPVARGGTGVTTATSGTFFSGPATGAAAAPSFRVITASDIPALDFSKITTGVVPVSQGGTGATSVSGARIALSAAAIATASIVGNGTTSSYGISNPFGNANVGVQVVRSQGAPLGRVVTPTITIAQSSPFAITVGFGANVPNGTNYTVIMTGVGA